MPLTHPSAGSCQRLVCIGQLTADVIVELDARLPLGDQTTGTTTRTPGGTAAIVAHNAGRLGLVPVAFAGHLGMDAQGRDGLSILEAAGVALDDLVHTARSPEVIVLVEPSGERTMISSPHLPDWHRLSPSFGPLDLAFFEGWHIFDESAYSGLITDARRQGATVAIDVCSASRATDPRAHARLLDALAPDIVLANEVEARAYGLEPAASDRLLVVHAGARPTRVWQHGLCTSHSVASCEVRDTTGAGDSFAAGFLSGVASHMPMAAAVSLGHDLAARVVSQTGPLLGAEIAMGVEVFA